MALGMALGMAVAGALALCNAAAHAQGYPSKPITVIVPFGPGSATDTIARLVSQNLGSALHASVIVENKVGANGAIAGAYVARSSPDGYTLLMATNSPLSAAPSLNKTIAYDPVKDFAPLSRVGSYIFILAVHPSVPAQSLRELIAYAKANPGKLSFASGNTSGLVAGETFKAWAGIDIVHVPYRSAPQAINDLLAGRVSMMFTDITVGMPHVKANSLRALATTRLERSTILGDLPTLNEAGVRGFDMDSWAGLFAPAGTPREIVLKLNTELRKIIDNPETKAKIAALGFEAFSSSPEELDAHVKVQLEKWTKMIKDAGIQPE
ncbi:MAG: tripartite tricarboxylate transporter substrate binding protein [Xanthobacteraceae bacterium]|nr:tripartite tricarboxylate transporter substrate binding protein [Xanthobacteraceae bacterium]